MKGKSGSSGVTSSNASSVTLSIYIAGYTFEKVFLFGIQKNKLVNGMVTQERKTENLTARSNKLR